MPASTTSLEASTPPTGPRNKAERLHEMCDPYGPEFPLDDDMLAELEPYPGEVPTSPQHFLALMFPKTPA